MDVQKIKQLRLDRTGDAGAESRGLRWWPVLVLVTLLLVAGGWIWMTSRSDPGKFTAPAQAPAAAATPAVGLPTNPQEPPASIPTSPPGTFVAAGYVEPIPPYPVKITPLVQGRLEEFDLLEGTPVKKGQMVARVDASAMELEAREAAAALEANTARVAHARALVERASGLAEIGSISRSELTQAQADLATLEAESKRLAAALATLQWRVENAVIPAPTDGLIYERHAHAGQWVGPGHESAIASIYDPAKLQVWVDVNQREAARVREGQRVEITADSVPGRTFIGRVVRIQPRASLAKNTIQAKIQFDEAPAGLRPDLSVRVVFHEAEKTTVSAVNHLERP